MTRPVLVSFVPLSVSVWPHSMVPLLLCRVVLRGRKKSWSSPLGRPVEVPLVEAEQPTSTSRWRPGPSPSTG
eukprot:SAG11_NODE_348_length_10402_cov_8.763467_2_plen_72_part_00